MLVQTEAYGLKLLVPANDSGVSQCLRENGEFARVEVELIEALVGDGIYIDVGANVGSIALPLAKTAKLVIAIEANRGFANVLAANALNNGLYNVSTVHAAIGEAERLARFPMIPLGQPGNLGVSGFHLAGKFAEEVVRMTTLDSITPPTTTIIKIDVEGYEPSVLKGAGRTLRELRPTWLVESSDDTPESWSVIDEFRQADYEIYWFFAPFVTVHPNRGVAPAKLRGDVNILAVPREKAQPDWEMQRVVLGGPRPTSIADFPYLTRYGFKLA
jgi:FkbM family methyltransferase